MIKGIEQLKDERPDLVELFEPMTREELLNQIYLEVIDAINMEERVQLFMNECTDLSKTTYTLDAIKSLINEKQEKDIRRFCADLVEDSEKDSNYIIKEVKNQANLL